MQLWMLPDVSRRPKLRQVPNWFLKTFPGSSRLAWVGPAALGWMGCRWLIPEFQFSSWRKENSVPSFGRACQVGARGPQIVDGKRQGLEWEGEIHGKHGPPHPSHAWNHCWSSQISLKFPVLGRGLRMGLGALCCHMLLRHWEDIFCLWKTINP